MFKSNQDQTKQNRSESVKSRAKTVDAAIDQALEQLALPRDQVDIEIIRAGSRGIFGLGAEDAVVMATPKPPPPEPKADLGDDNSPQPASDAQIDEETTAADGDAAPPEASDISDSVPPPSDDQTLDPAIQEGAKKILQELLSRMSVKADVSARIGDDLVDEGERPPLTLDITGPDLGLLIGRRGETLRALQFVVRQIISKEAGQWVPVVVDVESYLVRRRKSLQQLADRMADRVVFSSRKISLEPMPAQDRRIIHIQLRKHEHVYTSSVGDGDRRKVVILPK